VEIDLTTKLGLVIGKKTGKITMLSTFLLFYSHRLKEYMKKKEENKLVVNLTQ
jgi:hypothetical protein